MTNFARLSNQLQGTWEKNDVIDDLSRYSLLILDDLGAERKSEYMQEIVFNIIDSRYRTGLPFFITTNLSIEEIKKPVDISCTRIYDRILERCFPIEINGESRRRKNVKDTFFDTKELLGLLGDTDD
jgi:DNA replication protein DnaC